LVRNLGITAVAFCSLFSASAGAQDRVDPADVSGIERPARRPNEPARAVGNVMLWPLRLVVDLIFLATGTAGGLLENEQIVPRARDFFFTRGGELGIFPTLFVETGTNPNIGARMIASIEPYAATVRAGYGGPDSNVVEARMRLSSSGAWPGVLSLEGLHERRTGLGFLGIGQTPESDPRNQFQNGPSSGVYRERRERVVMGFGFRPLPDVEVLVSSSLTQRYVDDSADADVGPTLSQAFQPDSIPGAYRVSRNLYTEFALRYDSRPSRSGIATGVLFEAYGGAAEGIGYPTRFKRTGVVGAAFLPFVHSTTILSPKIVIDGLLSDKETPVPFTEMPAQPTFRGFANRRDYVSAVASLDYRWYVMRFVAARLFGDVARVAPSLSDMTLDHLRWAAGFGFDLHTSTSELGRFAVAGSPEGFHFLLTLGVPAGFGDRQHRD
jgi:hypothetical protein